MNFSLRFKIKHKCSPALFDIPKKLKLACNIFYVNEVPYSLHKLFSKLQVHGKVNKYLIKYMNMNYFSEGEIKRNAKGRGNLC